jgi:murein L,D-transpeptidase YafK
MLLSAPEPSPFLTQRWRLAMRRTGLTAALWLAILLAAARGSAQVDSRGDVVDLAVDPAIANHEVAVVVTKHARKLELFRRGSLVKAFPVVLGARPNGPKRYEGDMRTPEGEYRVADKRPHGRWRYFIEIDYPNSIDRVAYDTDASAGRIPLFSKRLPGPGGNVGIHGSDRPKDQAAGRDWTKGCIAVANDDVEVIYEFVTVGTPVIVRP